MRKAPKIIIQQEKHPVEKEWIAWTQASWEGNYPEIRIVMPLILPECVKQARSPPELFVEIINHELEHCMLWNYEEKGFRILAHGDKNGF